jgi:GNAT superfamily N-acetyltransferase
MGWADFTSDDLVVQQAPLDSARFGISVERVVVGEAATVGVDDLVRVIETSEADLLIVRYPASRVDWAFSLNTESRRGAVFHTGTLMYWRLSVGEGRGHPPTDEMEVVPHPSPEAVSEFVGRVFVNYPNHYSANPRLDPALALEGYREWATASALSGACVAIRNEDTLVAVATVETSEDFVEVLLAGVNPPWQGRGIYSSLLWAVEDFATECGLSSVYISTQAHNTRVQRSWARFGFTPVAAFETVHAMYAEVS